MAAVTDAAGYFEPAQSKGASVGTSTVKPIVFGGYPADKSDDYLMQSPNRGWAYILNLAGPVATNDVERLKTTLKNTLQFYVLPVEQEIVKEAKTAKNMVGLISENVTEEEDCVLIAILYQENDINSVDLESIWKMLVENKGCSAETMATKPKIFIFQEYQRPSPLVATDHPDSKSTPKPLVIPTHSDVLLMFGFGLYYIPTLCSVLDEGVAEDDVLSLLTKVNAKFKGSSKLPFFTSMLTYDLKFSTKEHQLEIDEDAIAERLQDITPGIISLEQKFAKLIRDIKAHMCTLEAEDKEDFEYLVRKIKKKAKLLGITPEFIKKGRELFNNHKNFDGCFN